MEEIITVMENGFGDVLTIHATDFGPAYVDLGDGSTRDFPDEDSAYSWCFRRGYRE